jgi:hypothetical protein
VWIRFTGHELCPLTAVAGLNTTGQQDVRSTRLLHICNEGIPPTTAATPSKLRNIFACSNSGTVGSNPTRGKCICIYCTYVLSSVGSSLATGWCLVQGILPNIYKFHSFLINPEIGTGRWAQSVKGGEDRGDSTKRNGMDAIRSCKTCLSNCRPHWRLSQGWLDLRRNKQFLNCLYLGPEEINKPNSFYMMMMVKFPMCIIH